MTAAAAGGDPDAAAGAPGLVVFDCDGVLVDSMGIDMRELTRAIAGAGGTLTPEQVDAAFHGMALADIERGVAEHLGRATPDGWMDAFLAARADAFERELRPVAGAVEAVEGVRSLGWETCIASGGRLQKMEQTLRVTGLADLFPRDRVFSAYAVARPKPAPDVFLHAARTCGFAPAACVVVEDSVPGVQAAVAAGMRTLAYTTGGIAAADRLVPLGAEPLHELRELPAHLGG